MTSMFELYFEDFFLENYHQNPIIFHYLHPKVLETGVYKVQNGREKLPWLTNFQESTGDFEVYFHAIQRWQDTMYDNRFKYGEIEALRRTVDYIINHISHSFTIPFYHDEPEESERIHHLVYMNQSKTFLKNAQMEKKQCLRLDCPPGYHQVYGLIENELYDEMYGFKCILCPDNHIKPFSGDAKCTQCDTQPYTIDNGQRTECIDPYANVGITFSHLQFYLILGSGSFSLLVTFCILVVFAIKRNTPIVRSSDKMLSMLHLTNMILTISSLLYLNLVQKMSVVKCIATNLIVSVL